MSWQDEVARLRAQSCIKWTRYDEDVIPAWVADMDFEPAPPITDALRALVDRGDLGYNFAAQSRIPEAFAEREARRYGWTPSTEGLRIFCDVVQALEVALWLHTEPGDGVVVLTPSYPPFYHAVAGTRCRLIDVPLVPGEWRLDPERLSAAVDSGARAILLCNPHNPTGRVFSRQELLEIARVAEEHDLLVISDEIWHDIVYAPAEHIPFASLSADVEARTITVTAASKSFNLAGMRCAIAHVGHEGLRSKLAELPGHVLGAVSSLGAEATLAAWTLGDEWLAETVAWLQANRDELVRRIRAELPGVGVTPPEGTYLAWLDFSALGLGDDPSRRILREARVALSPGLDFGEAGRGRARLNFATTGEMLGEIVDRLRRAFG